MVRRFKLFLIGMFLGTLAVIFFFGDRLDLFSSWMPNERVLLRLRQTELKMTEKAKCLMDCYEIERNDINTLMIEGDVDFKNSKTQEDPLIYLVHGSKKNLKKYSLTFAAKDSTSTIINAERTDISRSCECP
ncbi:MAG: DUF4258 domain-containing protein [Flavobacteriales bacterium]|nr:DUF4258 domain-containing protein [Flavobacteriales bacterium]